MAALLVAGLAPALHAGALTGTAMAAAAQLISGAKHTLCADLAVLDGGEISKALLQSAQRPVSLRLLLDPGAQSSREQGRALRKAFAAAGSTVTAAPSLELRWAPGAGKPWRRVMADDARLLAWKQSRPGERQDPNASAFGRHFEQRWALSVTTLPEALALEDDLKALPDPRDKDPRISRRREATGE